MFTPSPIVFRPSVSNVLSLANRLCRNTYTHLLSSYLTGQCLSMADGGHEALQDQMELVEDVREYDVPFHVRVSIDLKINVAYWYSVR